MEKDIVNSNNKIDSVKVFNIFTYLLEKEIATSREIAEELNIPHLEVLTVLSSPVFINKYYQIKAGVAKMDFSSTAFKELQKIITDPDTKTSDKINAIATAHKMLFPQEKKATTININLDKVLDELDATERDTIIDAE